MALESIIRGSTGWTVISFIISSIVIVALAVKMIGFIKTYKFFHNLPGSSSRSYLFGHIFQLPESGEKRLDFGRKRMDGGNGKYGCFWLGPFLPVIAVFHPEFVKKVMATSVPKSRGLGSAYSLIIPWIGEGLIVANGQRWARSRRLLTPAFHFDILKDYMAVYNEAADGLIKKLDKFAKTGESFDICPLLALCTLEVILRCSLGFKEDVQEKGHPYAQAARELSEIWSDRTRKPWKWPDFLFRMTSKGRKFYKNCDYVHKVAEEIIVKRKKELEQKKTDKDKHLDFIDILLSARDDKGEPMTTLEIRNEVDTFMFAGHDTTSMAIPWVLYTLAKHNDYQERVQTEIDSLLEGRDKPEILRQDLSKLEWLSLCNKETLRLYPPVPFIQRQLNEDLDFDGTKIPAGTAVTIPIVHLHRNSSVWDEPDEFKPERFQEGNKGSINNFAYIPFAAGGRNCIGQNFALNEEKVILGRIFQRYKISLAPDAKPPQRLPAAILKTENGIWLTLKRR